MNKPRSPGTEQEGTVSAVYGAFYNIIRDDREEVRGRLRGKLRLSTQTASSSRRPGGATTDTPDLKLRHPVMAGDRVRFRAIAGDDSVVDIRSVVPRRNALFRASGKRAHALGANLDRAILVSSLSQPDVNFRFVDRFLASCRHGQVEPLLLFSKLDLLTDDDEADYKQEVCRVYERLGYATIYLDLLGCQPIEQFAQLQALTDQGLNLLAGNSGTGKSTLLNLLIGRQSAETAQVSESTHKGRHTTTNPRLLETKSGGRFIDTPGVKEWGILHLGRRDVFAGFPELDESAADCPFRNCEHRPEDGSCAVQDFLDRAGADETGELMHPERLVSLELMLESLEHPDRIRYGDYVKPTGRLHGLEGD